MSALFKAGDIVECIDDNYTDPKRPLPMIGTIYLKIAPRKGTLWVVTGVGTFTWKGLDQVFIRLQDQPDESWFTTDYFRQLTESEVASKLEWAASL